MVAGGQGEGLREAEANSPWAQTDIFSYPKRLPAELYSLAPSDRDFGLDKRYTKWER